MKFLLLILFTTHLKQASLDISELQNENNAKFKDFNFHVGLYHVVQKEIFCNGAIVAETTAVTTARCFFESKTENRHLAWNILVVHGDVKVNTLKTKRYKIVRVFLHANFSVKGVENNIALIRVNESFPAANVIKLPEKAVKTPSTCLVSSWSRSNEPLPGIKYSQVHVEPWSECIKNYMRVNLILNLYDRLFCSRGSCYRDSAGPLVCDQTLYGLSAFGVDCTINYPDLFVDIFAFSKWIQNGIAQNVTSLDEDDDPYDILASGEVIDDTEVTTEADEKDLKSEEEELHYPDKRDGPSLMADEEYEEGFEEKDGGSASTLNLNRYLVTIFICYLFLY